MSPKGGAEFLVGISMHALDLCQEAMMWTWLDHSALVSAMPMLKACCLHNG